MKLKRFLKDVTYHRKRADIGMSLALQSASEDSMSSSDVSDNDDNDGNDCVVILHPTDVVNSV